MLSKSLKKTEEQKSCLVQLQIRAEKYKKYYSTHWMVVKIPDHSQKLSNNQLSKAKFRGPFWAKNFLILPCLITSFDCTIITLPNISCRVLNIKPQTDTVFFVEENIRLKWVSLPYFSQLHILEWPSCTDFRLVIC